MSEENHNKRNDFKEKNYHSSNQQKNGSDISENKNSFYPWIKTNSKCNFFKGILKLHYEILDFYEFIKLTDEEIALRNKTYKLNIGEAEEAYRFEYVGKDSGIYNAGDADYDAINEATLEMITNKEEYK